MPSPYDIDVEKISDILPGQPGSSGSDKNFLARVQLRLAGLVSEWDCAEATLDLLFLAYLLEASSFGYFAFGPVTIDVRVVEDLVRRTTRRSVGAGSQRKASYSDDALRFFKALAAESEASARARLDERDFLLAFMSVGEGIPARVFSELGVSPEAVRRFVPERAGVERRLYSPEEAAAYLGVHVKTVRGWIRSGLLPASRLAGQRVLRIKSGDLENLLEPVQRGDADE